MEARRGEIRAAELDAQHDSPARSAAKGDAQELVAIRPTTDLAAPAARPTNQQGRGVPPRGGSRRSLIFTQPGRWRTRSPAPALPWERSLL